MNCYKKIKKTIFVGIVSAFIILPISLNADTGWSYHQQSDSLNNQTYSYAQSPLPKPGLYDNIMLSLVCKDHKLQAVVETDELITSQGSSFSMEYQVDQLAPVTLSMKTFPDSKRKAYTETNAKRMADDLLTGQVIFIKINTMIKTVLSSSINLDNASTTIKQVLIDCTQLDTEKPPKSLNNYTFNDFESDFKKLPLIQQQKLLNQLKQLVINTP